MKQIIDWKLTFIFPIVLTFFPLSSCSQKGKYPKGINHVVVIGVDGMSVQGFLEASTPCMDSLLHNGAYNYHVRSVLPTISKPNWNAMLCGAGPEATGVIDNSWKRSFDKFPPVAMSENRIFPNIFSVIRQQWPDAEIGSLYQWDGFEDMLETELLDKHETYPTHKETAEKTAEYILNKKPNFVFIQLDEVDGVGHSKGHMSHEYIQTIEEIDKSICVIIDAIKEAGIEESTMVMIVSDHGGIFFRHGENTYEELTTPIIYAGKGIKTGYQIKQQIYRYDVAADVAFALGLKIPQVWTGRPVKAAYLGFDEPENIFKGAVILPPPVFISEKIKTVYGGLFVDTVAEVKLKTPIGIDGEIRYTIDGTTPTRVSALYSEPFNLKESAIVNAKIFNDEGESPMISSQYRMAYSNAGNGINYSLFSLPGEKNMPSFVNKTPVCKGICYEIGLNTPDIISLKNQCKTDYGMTFTGWLKIDFDAKYTFRIWSDGGYRLFIDYRLITENNSLDGSNNVGSIQLKKGVYPFKVEYFTNKNGGLLDVYYEASGMPIRIVPGNKFFRIKKEL
ncbi:MAG: alkaline phosphatase family protein [Massilibacteroides sp.]|nr:alkaline phosphatase family protein [Massilibacteroides sp.]MDD3062386.1 alkaline phosphatase family protein [Massilibacteroides sp.]